MMRKLEVPQTCTPAPSDKDADPPVIVVQPAGSAKAAFATVISLDSIMAASFARLAADSDDVGRAFRTEVGHLFRSKSAGRSD